MQREGQIAAQRPHPTQRAEPSSFLASACNPLYPGEASLFSSGYCLVTAGDNIILKVNAIPLIISTRKTFFAISLIAINASFLFSPVLPYKIFKDGSQNNIYKCQRQKHFPSQ